MWKCRKCGEQIEEQFDACWSCGTSRVEDGSDTFAPSESIVDSEPAVADEGVDNTAEQVLARILHLQNEQQQVLASMEWKVGCLFAYMVFGIVVGILVALLTLAR